MLDARWYTRTECELATGSDHGEDVVRTLRHAVKVAPTAAPEERVALLAFDDGVLAGRMLFTYGVLNDDGVDIRVAAGQDLFTDSRFRGKGIGSALIQKSLEIGMPCIYSGMSGQAQPIYERLGFSFIDTSPIYRCPVRFAGGLRHWRIMRDRAASRGPHTGVGVREFRDILRSRQALRQPNDPTWNPVSADDAMDVVERLAALRHCRFQVPWNMSVLESTLRGRNPKQDAWVLSAGQVKDNKQYLVSIVRRKAEARIPFTRMNIAFADGHVNEIYPPVSDPAVASGLLKAVFDAASRRRYSNLSIYAMTPAIESACRMYGLAQVGAKSVAIQPLGLDGLRRVAVTDSSQWWCRALNENHFEEPAYPGAVRSHRGALTGSAKK